MKKIYSSFSNAYQGLVHCISNEQNARIHLMIMILTTIMALLLHISRIEWLMIILCFGFVFSAELINTSIERLSDKVCLEQDLFIKQTKDLAASAVLFAALCSAVIACIIFIPKLMAML